MLKNNLVLTIAIGDFYNEVSKYTIPTIKAYANKFGADFLCITDGDTKYASQKWKKFSIYELLDNYKRILYVDIDILIRDDAPNIFDIVPETKLGMFNEGKYANRLEFIKQASEYYNESIKNWKGNFYNSGVMVIPRKYKSIFKLPIGVDYVETDQPYINLRILNDNIDMYDLDFKFNRMDIQDKYCGVSRLDSYFVHYAGAPQSQLIPVLQKDIQQWEIDKPKYEYKRNILISVTGGLGDQICAEPVIRYLKNMYNGSNIHIVTHFPEIFSHINCNIYKHTDWKGINDAIITMHSCPDESSSEHKLSHALFHAIDFASISMLRRTIPNIDKQINLTINNSDLEFINGIISEIKTNKPIVVVHPGKWWPSKTFPVEWWQKLIDKLSEELTVVLIGKLIDDEQGYQPVICPNDGIDLRDMTSIGELTALISLSNCLITNDSSPLHIAGAFDNWIVVMPTCKHPDQILPYRNGTQYYKTITLYKNLLINDLETRFTEFNVDTIDKIPKDKTISDYIPDVERVYNEVIKTYKKTP